MIPLKTCELARTIEWLRFTWTQRDPDDREDPKTELRGSRKSEYTANQLVPSSHGIYPVYRP